MEEQMAAEISFCFNGFPQSRATDVDALIFTARRAVEGIDPEAVIRTCQAFSAAEIEGQSLDFPPAVPRFVKACRDMQAAMEYARRPKIEVEPEPEMTTEQRERMKQRWAELIKSFERAE